MNNAKHNIRRTPCQLARRKSDRGCEPSSLKLSSRLFRLFPIYLDKVLSVTDGDTKRTFTYHADGQLARATYAPGHSPASESFEWDGLALIQRGDEQFINEPHVGGGNPVASSKGTSYFNDALGTTVGARSNGKYSAAALTAFGENVSVDSPTPTQNSNFFTGKPYVEGLGHAFLMRNYRASLAKWQTADPLGYPDGWNALAYCNNGVTGAVDLWGGVTVKCQCNGATVDTADDIEPSRESDDTDEGGYFSVYVKDIQRLGGTATIILDLSICIDIILRNNVDIRVGSISEYAPHNGKHDNSMGRNCVYEAILAHEKAHATYYLQHQLGEFSSLLDKLNIDDASKSMSEIEELVKRAFDESWESGRLGSNTAANQATFDWYNSHPEWQKIHPVGGMRRWRKIE